MVQQIAQSDAHPRGHRQLELGAGEDGRELGDNKMQQHHKRAGKAAHYDHGIVERTANVGSDLVFMFRDVDEPIEHRR